MKTSVMIDSYGCPHPDLQPLFDESIRTAKREVEKAIADHEDRVMRMYRMIQTRLPADPQVTKDEKPEDSTHED